jgi:hypothetical protein
MEHIREIQEVIDEHKSELPTGVATRVMAACQKAYDDQPELYKVVWTVVQSHAFVKRSVDYPDDRDEDTAPVTLSHETQTFIVEAVEVEQEYCFSCNLPHMLTRGKLPKRWFRDNHKWPVVLSTHESSRATIIHSIVRYEPTRPE